MKCEKYRKVLIEQAAAGGKVEGKLAVHLEECAPCRTKLRHEEEFFAAIDDALRSKVNERPRDGFLAGVRAQIREQVPSKSQLIPSWSLAGAVLALALVAVSHLWTATPGQPVEGKRLGAVGLKEPTVVAEHPLELADSGSKNLDARVRTLHSRAHRLVAVQVASRELEVLVPPDEGKAFHQFVARLQGQEQVAQAVASPVVSSVPDQKDELSEIAPVEIARLQLEPLASENLRDRNKVKIESLCNVITCQSY